MITVFFRTIVIYAILLISVRIMGKRQLGELELSELVTTLMVSELAVLPISDKRIPVLYGIVPILVLLSVEVIISQIITVSPVAKRIFCGTPAILIRDGKIDEKALRRARIGVDELMSELRQNGCAGPDGVKYAIIEANGKLSVILKAASSPPNAEDLSVKVKEKGIEHSVIINSKISRRSLAQAEKNSEWLERELGEHRASPEEILLMTVDDTGKVRIQKKKKSRKRKGAGLE